MLSVILQHEQLAPGFDLPELARLTDGYSGSDLHNLCVAAAYRPIRDLLAAEKKAATAADEMVTAAAAADKAPAAEEAAAAGKAAETCKAAHADTPAAAGAAGGAGDADAAGADAGAAPRDGVQQQPAPAAPAAGTKAGPSCAAAGGGRGEAAKLPAPALRPLTLSDFKAAMSQVGASVCQDAHHMGELKAWNEQYGEGGARTKAPLPYFM